MHVMYDLAQIFKLTFTHNLDTCCFAFDSVVSPGCSFMQAIYFEC